MSRSRPPIDLESYKQEIVTLFLSGSTADSIADHLLQLYEITNISGRTIRRRLNTWGISKRQKTEDSPQLRARISVLFYQCCLADKEMLGVLQQEGYTLGEYGLQRIRLNLGLSRKISILDREKADAKLLEIVQEELDKGTIEGYGRGYLHTYFRQHGHCFSRYITTSDCYINSYIFTNSLFNNLGIGSSALYGS